MQAPRAIQYALPLCLALAVAGGCDSADEKASGGASATQGARTSTSTSPEGVQVFFPLASSAIGLYREHGSVHVGDNWDKARDLFPEPAKGAYPMHELPPGFGSRFTAEGWETNRGEGFGVIAYQNQVVAALYHTTGVDEERVKEIEALHRTSTADIYPLTITGKSIRYWFWTTNDSKQRLMICAYANPRHKGFDLTLAMGDSQALNALGAAPSIAQRDQARLDNGIPAVIKEEKPELAPLSEPKSSSPRY